MARNHVWDNAASSQHLRARTVSSPHLLYALLLGVVGVVGEGEEAEGRRQGSLL